MRCDVWRRVLLLGAVTMLGTACTATQPVNPTGLTGGQVACVDGPRPILDCRGALKQFAQDFKADLSFMGKAQLGMGLNTAKLSEADTLTSDMIQHYYQTCTLYNACVITRQDYAQKMDKLQDIQFQVRRTLIATGGAATTQQNIQINPPPFGAGVPSSSGMAPSLPPGGFPPGTNPSLSPGFPPQISPPIGSAPPSGFPPGSGTTGFPPPSTGFPPGPSSGFPQTPSTGIGSIPSAGQPSPTGGFPPPSGAPPGASPQANPMDTVIDLLRQGSQQFRGGAPVQTSSVGDLQSSLRSMLVSLDRDTNRQRPQLAAGRAVVANFTEEGRSWASPVGAFLQDQVTAIVQQNGLFKSGATTQTRGITVKEVAGVANPNDPKSLGALYNSEVVITGSYRPQGDQVSLQLMVLDDKGTEVARTMNQIPAQTIPNVVPAQPVNAADTTQLLTSFAQVAPQPPGTARVELTTNRPGVGASFRLGEDIVFFVTSTTDGYLYLFHIDGDKNVTRIFPNQYQRDARIGAGGAIQVPAVGAPFKFEASPPFGLETTFGIVTAAPLEEQELAAVTAGLAKPEQRAAALRSIWEKGARSGRPASWNSVTVLIRP